MNRLVFILILAICTISLFQLAHALSFGGSVSPVIIVNSTGGSASFTQNNNTNSNSNSNNNTGNSNTNTNNNTNSNTNTNTNQNSNNNNVNTNSNSNSNSYSNYNSNTNTNTNSNQQSSQELPFDLVMNNQQKQIIAADITANTNLTILVEKTGQQDPVLVTYLSNGTSIKLQILPDLAYNIMEANFTASCRFNCVIGLDEIKVNDQNRIAYQIETKKQNKFLFFFNINSNTQVYVDALTGEIINPN